MSRWFDGVRGRVVLTVVAVTACLYSLLGTLGFVQIANSGRAEIRERIGTVLDQLDAGLQTGNGTITISTPDGVFAYAEDPAAVRLRPTSGDVVVERMVTVGTTKVRLVGRASQARLTDSLRALYRGLWIGVPVAVVLTAVAAGLSTRRALRPVSEITHFAAGIGLHDAAARVPVPGTGDEIDDLARTVNEMLDRIAAGRAAQRQFTSDAAHELRTPLMALQGEIELAQRDRAAAVRDAGFLDRVETLARRLGNRVDDLVLLSTLDEQPPLHLTVEAVLDRVRVESESTPGTIEISGDGDVEIELDRKLIGRAIRNLVANAQRHAHSRVRVTVEDGEDRVWVHVDDDGVGIAADDAVVIFDRFRRLEEARNADSGGAGLGLAIVASVATAHGGGVSAGPGALGGARFSLWLPKRHEPAGGG